jgi:hypothetical protein
MTPGIAFFVLLFGVGCALIGMYVITLDEVEESDHPYHPQPEDHIG